jgi:hypothetical protein
MLESLASRIRRVRPPCYSVKRELHHHLALAATSQQFIMDSATVPLWGPCAPCSRCCRLSVSLARTREAVNALRQPRAPEPVPHEEELLRCARTRVGPFASEGALRHHIRNSHGKCSWAVNGYLREAVLSRRPGTFPDFAPLAAPPGARKQTADRLCGSPGDEPFPSSALPLDLWERVLSNLEAPDVRAAACVCTQLRAAAERLWQPLFQRRWGMLAVQPDAGWRAAYSARCASMAAMRCTSCDDTIVAVVYGYPSTTLVAAQAAGDVLLGGDYLIDGDPMWACRRCDARWASWPWARGGAVPLSSRR